MKKYILISFLFHLLLSLEITDEGRVHIIDSTNNEIYITIYNFDNWPVSLKIDSITMNIPNKPQIQDDTFMELRYFSEMIPPKSTLFYPIFIDTTTTGDFMYEIRFKTGNENIYLLPLQFTKK
jgi:hypothetical protein